MRALSPERILDLWGDLATASPTRRALAVLAAAESPTVAGESSDERLERLASLPLGERDQLLLALRETTLGRPLDCRTSCPECGEELELTIESSALSREAPSPGQVQRLVAGEVEAEARLPTSADLLAAEACQDGEAAERLLARRCLPRLWRSGRPIEPDELSDDEVATLADRLAEADPGSDLVLELTCAACGHGWREVLDVGTFFATELESVARRLLAEVHLLARAYGWRETEVLALPAHRRSAYLDLIAGETGGGEPIAGGSYP